MMWPSTKTQPTTNDRASFSDSVLGLGTMLSRILSNSSPASTTTVLSEEKKSNMTEPERSLSRGRLQSSGRGGAGNIRSTSTSRDGRPATDGPDDFSQTRGRELAVSAKLTHSGRGGAGNVRSPSREPSTPTPEEREILAHATQRDAELPHSSGRGGLGNIVGSRSRSRSRPADVHSSGRGGAGNIVHSAAGLERLEEQERREHLVKEGVHSSGRGGAGNLRVAPSPGIDVAAHSHEAHQTHSSGRGGAGNIREASKSREASRTRDTSALTSTDTEGKGRSKDHGVVGDIWDRVMGKERKE